MSTFATIFDLVGASGFVAAVGSVFGLGRLHQKVESQSDLLERLEEETRSTAISHGAMAVTLGRVEERMNNIKDDLTEIKAAVRKD